MTRELLFSVTLKDCVVETKRGHGNGGQNRNKRDTAVRIVHAPSGAVGECEEERSQLQNKRAAFMRMVATPAFRFWVHQETERLRTGKTAEERVAEEMLPEKLRIEVSRGGKWVAE